MRLKEVYAIECVCGKRSEIEPAGEPKLRFRCSQCGVLSEIEFRVAEEQEVEEVSAVCAAA